MKWLMVLMLSLVAGCSSTNNTGLTMTDTMEMRRLAAEHFPDSVPGRFNLTIKAGGQQRGYMYLNSEEDYRDPRAVTVRFSPALVEAFYKQYQQPPLDVFQDKNVVVTGQLKQITIGFYSMGRRTEKYYYQTHIILDSIDDISILD